MTTEIQIKSLEALARFKWCARVLVKPFNPLYCLGAVSRRERNNCAHQNLVSLAQTRADAGLIRKVASKIDRILLQSATKLRSYLKAFVILKHSATSFFFVILLLPKQAIGSICLEIQPRAHFYRSNSLSKSMILRFFCPG